MAKSEPRTFAMLLGKLIPNELKLQCAGDGLPLLIVRDYTGLSDEERAAIDSVREGRESA